MAKMFYLPLSVIGLTLAFFSCSSAIEKPLSHHQWKHRVLIIFTDKSVLQTLDQYKAEVVDRHLVYYFISEQGEVISNSEKTFTKNWGLSLKNKYSAPDSAVILIGKDGEVKSKGTTLDIKAMFNLIDSMPMRKAEIRSKQ